MIPLSGDASVVHNKEYVDALHRFALEFRTQDLTEILLKQGDDHHRSVQISLQELKSDQRFESLAKLLCTEPRTILPLFDEALQKAEADIVATHEFRNKMSVKPRVHARITLSEGAEMRRSINSIGLQDVGRFLAVHGRVVRTGPVKTREGEREYECDACKTRFKVKPQFEQDNKVTLPATCPSDGSKSCKGATFTFVEGSKVCHKYQESEIQGQTFGQGVGSVPRSLVVVLEDDLVDCCKTSDDLEVTGVLCAKGNVVESASSQVPELVILANSVRRASLDKAAVDQSVGTLEKSKELRQQRLSSQSNGRSGSFKGFGPQVPTGSSPSLAGIVEHPAANHSPLAGAPGSGRSVDSLGGSGEFDTIPLPASATKLDVLGSGIPISRLHSVSATSLQEQGRQDSLSAKAPPPIHIPDSSFSHFPTAPASPPHPPNNPFLDKPIDVGAPHPLRTHSRGRDRTVQNATWQPSSLPSSSLASKLPPLSPSKQPPTRARRSSDPLTIANPGGSATNYPQTWVNPLNTEISLGAPAEKPGNGIGPRPLSPHETRITVEGSPRSDGPAAPVPAKSTEAGSSDEDDGGPLLQAWRSGKLPIEMRSDSTLGRLNKRLPSFKKFDSPGRGSKKEQFDTVDLDTIIPASDGNVSPELGGRFGGRGNVLGFESPKPMPSKVFTRTKTSRLGDPRENGMFASKETMVRAPEAVMKSGLLSKSGMLDSGKPPKSGLLQNLRSGLMERSNSGVLESVRPAKSGLLAKSGFLGKTKTKDHRSGQNPKSGQLERVDEDDDPLSLDDVPDNWWAEQSGCGWFTILQWVALVVIIALFITSTAVWGEVKLLGIRQWKWLLIALVVISGRLISGWAVKIAVFIFERNFLMKKRVLYFVYSLKNGVQNCLWIGLVTACWYGVMDPKVRDVDNRLQYVTRVILCVFVASALKVAEVLFIKVTASRYHVNRFFERIQDTLFHQHILETLSAPPTLGWEVTEKEAEATPQSMTVPNSPQISRTFGATIRRRSLSGPLGGSTGQKTPEGTPRSGRSSAPRDKVVEQDTGKIDIDKLEQLSSTTVSAWSMKRLINLVRYQGISTYSDVVEAGEEINSEMAAKAAARQIFYNVAKPDSRYINIDDLQRFLTGDEVARTWMMFEGAVEKGHVTKKSLKAWVVQVYNERRSLSLTLNDTKTVVKKLKHVVDALMWVIIVIVWLTILGIASSNLWVVISSLLISWVFVFGNMAKTLFEALVFIFVMHPFDVGDRIEIDGNQMVVEEMNILTTVFLRPDNGKSYMPNSVLAQKQITNMGRSPDMGEALDFYVDVTTPAEKIAALKERMGEYIKTLPHHWYPTFFLLVRDVDKSTNRMQCSFWGQHTQNHQNAGERHTRRGALLQHLLANMRELGINYSVPVQEVRLGGNLESFRKS